MKILAVDLGLARTGIAVSDPRELLASPVGTLEEYNLDRLVTRVAAIAAEQRAELIVGAHPRLSRMSCRSEQL